MARLSRLRHLRHGAFARVRRRGKVLDWLGSVVTTLTGTGVTSAFTATPSVAATGVLTFTSQPNDGDTATIGTKVYTFQTVLTTGEGNVLIGAAATNTIDNLIAAINHAAGSGSLYSGSFADPLVTAAAGTGDTMDVTARVKGLSGNDIVTAESTATVRLEWTTAMSGGVDPTLSDTGHGLVTGEHPIQVSNSGGALPAGLSVSTVYWPIAVDANTFKLATSREAARRNVHVDITSAGTGTHSQFRPAEADLDIHGWNKVARPEQLQAASDIDSIVQTQ